MQLLGNTEQEKQVYKEALKEAKKSAGASFDLDNFNSQWCEVHNIQVVPVGRSEAATHKENTQSIERVAGEIIASDDIAGCEDERLREVVRDIVAGIEAYKIQDDVVKYSKTKNGTLQFCACLSSVCDNVVKPSRILKKAPYSAIGNTKGLSNNNAYNTDYLIKFIDICVKLCGREGLCFNRALYLALTGITYDYLTGRRDYFTSADIHLYEKVLAAENIQSVNFAYNSDIGNMRNLNEGEAKIRTDNTAPGSLVDASALRALPLK